MYFNVQIKLKVVGDLVVIVVFMLDFVIMFAFVINLVVVVQVVELIETDFGEEVQFDLGWGLQLP